MSSRMTSPENRRASSAAHRNVETARVTSIRAHFSGLPPSRATASARSSRRSAIRFDTCIRASARTWIGRCRVSSNADAAPATARSTSSAVGFPISATTLPSNGLVTSNEPSPVRHSPAT